MLWQPATAAEVPFPERCEQAITTALGSLPAGARVSITIREIGGDRRGFTREGDQSIPLASLTKLFVSAAALVELGPDYHFETRLVGLGPLASDGSLPGLGIIAGGDPCLDEHFTDRQPDRVFDDWAAQLQTKGVTRITGDLVIDARLFAGPIRPPGYPQDPVNLMKWYAAPASAFAWNDNCIEARVVPDAPGKPARVEVRPHSSRILVDNRTTTAKQAVPSTLIVSRAANANRLLVKGSYSKTTSWFPMAIQADPDLLAGDHLVHRLALAGIALEGTVRLGEVDPTAGNLLVHHRSPLLPAVTILNQRSQNFYGEQILRILGHRRHGSGSVETGTRAVAEILAADPIIDGFSLVDGCGLGYENRASTDTVVALLAAMHLHGHSTVYRASLKEQWSGKIRCQVKTGSLAISRGLAGYIPGPDDRIYAFAFVIDRGKAVSFTWASPLRDALFKAIATAVACGK